MFPDDYHLNTLETLLQTCTELHEQVDVRSIMVNFMDRLAAYADARVQEGTPRGEAIPPSVAAFDLFSTYSAKVVEAGKGAMDTKDILGLEVSLLGFGLKCHPDRPDYVNGVLEFCATLLDKVTSGKCVWPPAGTAPRSPRRPRPHTHTHTHSPSPPPTPAC